MKWLTYPKQMTIGICILIIGHVFSWMTGITSFQNAGWIIYGLLFLLHPVWLESANRNPHISNYVRLTGAVIVLIGCTIRFGGEDDFLQTRISDSLGIDVSKGVIEISYDDHSGFQGDGTSYAVLTFTGDELEKQISAPGGWNRLPLNHTLETLIYGTRTATAATGPFLGITFPRIEEGYWYFYDRQGQTHGDSEVLNRGSYNYTFAIYDIDSDKLYYCEYDT